MQLKTVYEDHTNFTAINVNLTGMEACAHFLLSFSHQLDLQYAPDHCPDRAPWKYFPFRENGKKISIVTLGNVQTRLGVFTVAYTSKSPDNIDTVFVYNVFGNHRLYKGELKELVKAAIEQKDITTDFVYQASGHCPIVNIVLQEYCGERFVLKNVDGQLLLKFKLSAIDAREAYELALQRIRKFSAFLAVETNIQFTFNDPIVQNSTWDNPEIENAGLYFPDFIDSYPINDEKLMLSENGYKFVDEHIFTKRDSSSDSVVRAFLAGAEHIWEGLDIENKIQENVLAVFPGVVLATKPVDVKVQSVVTKSLTNYMSALEAATIDDGTHDRCEYCNTELYHISHRIKDIATKYLTAELGNVYSKFYSLRSKYLHAGIFATGIDTIHARPMLDVTTGTGLADAGFITIRFGGRSHLFSVMNIKEWTTYILRCYYQEKLYGRTEFQGWDDGNNNNSTGLIAHYNGIDVKLLSDNSDIELVDMIIV